MRKKTIKRGLKKANKELKYWFRELTYLLLVIGVDGFENLIDWLRQII